jgi:hypothetical protein
LTGRAAARKESPSEGDLRNESPPARMFGPGAFRVLAPRLVMIIRHLEAP